MNDINLVDMITVRERTAQFRRDAEQQRLVNLALEQTPRRHVWTSLLCRLRAMQARLRPRMTPDIPCAVGRALTEAG